MNIHFGIRFAGKVHATGDLCKKPLPVIGNLGLFCLNLFSKNLSD